MKEVSTSEKKQRMIDEKNASAIEVGESISVHESVFGSFHKDKNVNAVVNAVNADGTYSIIEGDGSVNNRKATITREQILARQTWEVGANPFQDDDMSIRFVSFTLESILFGLGIMRDDDKYKSKKGYLISRLNWNPFVIDKNGETIRYQRPFVWTLEENQLLIESIYQRIECGRILVRKRSWAEVDKMDEADCAFSDIVDGKQRLNAIRGFMSNEYPDLSGNYYGDLSNKAQHQFTNHQLFSYAEMQENTPDDKVIKQFLKLNFAGVPQSKEHIEFIRSINF